MENICVLNDGGTILSVKEIHDGDEEDTEGRLVMELSRVSARREGARGEVAFRPDNFPESVKENSGSVSIKDRLEN